METFVRRMKAAVHPSLFGVLFRGQPAPEGSELESQANRATEGPDAWQPIDPSYREEHADGMHIFRNLPVPLRDGVEILMDLFLPEDAVRVAPILSWGVYGKEDLPPRWAPGADVDPSWQSKYTVFEAADPVYWTRHGYAVAYVNPRGTWYSGGVHRGHANLFEAEDVYDVIEWLGTQTWSTGKVGMSGVSYYSIMQWFAAATRPPHLAAINPWEGFTDRYRDAVYHGGVLEDGLNSLWWDAETKFGLGETEDGFRMIEEHPFYDDYWKQCTVDLEQITVPAYVVASWGDQGLHTRGTLEGYRRISSAQKWLEVHGQKKWEYQYRPENVDRSREFFDHFLLGKTTALEEWAPVRLQVRVEGKSGYWTEEAEWPIARTEYRRLHLGTAERLTIGVVAPAQATYAPNMQGSCLRWRYTFDRDTEVTGYSALRLWISVAGGVDTDLFVILDKLDRDGKAVNFVRFSVFEDGPVAMGWQRASHRELDPAKTSEFQPWHTHSGEQPLLAGEIVPVDVEIWPSSTLFRAGESLQLTVQGRDAHEVPPGGVGMQHTRTQPCEQVTVWMGTEYDSYLVVPIVPEEENL